MQPGDMFLLMNQNYEIIASIGPILFDIHKLPVVLDTEVGPKFLQKYQQILFLETRVTSVTMSTRIYDANDKLLYLVGYKKLYVHVGLLTDHLSFMVHERLAVLAILGWSFMIILAGVFNPEHVPWN